jgi:hypothetical protein
LYCYTGGNLCAAVLLRRRDLHAAAAKIAKTTTTTFPWRFVNLVYGIFDVAETPSVEAFGDRRLVETAKDVQYFGDCYCPVGLALFTTLFRSPNTS